jgi:hypothetical protein
MKKQILFPLLTTVLLMAVGSAYAQLGSAQEVRANVPFDYKVGNATMKTGNCSIRGTLTANVLSIRCAGSETKLALSGIVSGKPATETKLVFHKYGDEYFLAQVWLKGEDTGRELPRTRTENELMSKASPDSVVILAQK